MTNYDPRYLAGVMLFNEGAFFEAHEVWESLWLQDHTEAKRFYQGLIQAAVCLLHLNNGNYRGAARLFHSARQYMEPYRPVYHGLDIEDFWRQFDETCGPYLHSQTAVTETPRKYPRICLRPEPTQWPDPEMYLLQDE